MKTNYILFFLVSVMISLTSLKTAYADSMDSNRFHLEYGTVQVQNSGDTALTQSSGQYGLPTDDQVEFNAKGYVLKQKANERIQFSINNTSLPFTDDFQHSLSITLSPIESAEVQASIVQESPLQTFNGDTLSPLDCNKDCSITTASEWNDSYTGLSYNMSGMGTPLDFKNSTFVRPLPDVSLAQSAIAVLQTLRNTSQTVTGKLTTRLHLPSSKQGTYTTTLTIITSPTF